MKGVMSCPTCDDGNNTFYFGYISSYYVDECEARCLAESRCYIYTFYPIDYNSDDEWRGQCIGTSYETNVYVYDYNVLSGVREESIIGNLKDHFISATTFVCTYLLFFAKI